MYIFNFDELLKKYAGKAGFILPVWNLSACYRNWDLVRFP
jgi:hypothetical protein